MCIVRVHTPGCIRTKNLWCISNFSRSNFFGILFYFQSNILSSKWSILRARLSVIKNNHTFFWNMTKYRLSAKQFSGRAVNQSQRLRSCNDVWMKYFVIYWIKYLFHYTNEKTVIICRLQLVQRFKFSNILNREKKWKKSFSSNKTLFKTPVQHHMDACVMLNSCTLCLLHLSTFVCTLSFLASFLEQMSAGLLEIINTLI